MLTLCHHDLTNKRLGYRRVTAGTPSSDLCTGWRLMNASSHSPTQFLQPANLTTYTIWSLSSLQVEPAPHLLSPSTICIFLITNLQLLFHICITLPVESAPFFIPSTSFCSLSSWFTSFCAYHLVTATIFAVTITPSAFHSRLKTHLFHKSFPPYSFSFLLDCLHGSWTFTELSAWHWRLFVLVSCISFVVLSWSQSHSAFQSTLNSSIVYYPAMQKWFKPFVNDDNTTRTISADLRPTDHDRMSVTLTDPRLRLKIVNGVSAWQSKLIA